jgi:mannosyltransferase
MTIPTSITLDCSIFGLQRFGGVSNYWARVVDYVSLEPGLLGNLVLPSHLLYRHFNDAWLTRMRVRRELLGVGIGRYLPVSSAVKDVVFHTPYYRLPLRKVRKYVVTVHDFTYERFRTGLPRFVHSKQKHLSIYLADAIICVSNSTRRDVLEFCPKVDASKLHVIHLGVDLTSFYQEPSPAFEAHDKTVLFVGQRGGYKRFDLAVEAVRASPRLSLGIIGPALTDAERELLVERLGSRWCEFGPVSNVDLRRLYSSAFAFIFPSDYEGFGLPVLEAMACGCPVVAACLSSLPEVGGQSASYAENQCGESYAAVLNALDNLAVREAVVRAGIERAAQFDWSTTLQKTKTVYLDT